MINKHVSNKTPQGDLNMMTVLQAISARLVRIETRQARQMEREGMSPQGITHAHSDTRSVCVCPGAST